MKTVLLLATLIAAPLIAATPDAGGSYHVVQRIPVPGDGGWDYLTVDNASRRLYVSHGTKVDVLDADSGAVKGMIPDTLGVHGIAVVPKLGRGFISCGKAGVVKVFDLTTLKPVTEVTTGKNPDAIIYDSATNRIFVSNGGSQSVTAISAADAKVEGTIDVGGKPEFAVSDGKGQVFVNIEDKNVLLAIDAQKLTINNRWPVEGCEAPGSIAMDRTNHRLFLGCHNQKMAVVNADNGHVIASLPIGSGVDATSYDPKSQLVFNSNSDGTVTVIRQASPDSYSVIGNVATQPGAKTMALDPKTQRLFLSAAEYGPASAAADVQPKAKRPVLPGTFQILVLGK
jgi:DNA-binding beta-propeller fold protein YncE